MYTRPYFQSNSDFSVPQKYDGNALKDEASNESVEDELTSAENEETNEELRAPWDEKSIEKSEYTQAASATIDTKRGILGGIMKSLPFSALPFKFNFGGNDGFKLGYEEILIAAVALFLIFSKSGDKECGIALLTLIFIT